VVKIISEFGVLANFPDRTEADLYLWLMEYRAQLAESTGVEVPLAPVAEELVSRYSLKPQHRLERVGRWFLEAVTPPALVDGPPPGLWQQRTKSRLQASLFADILYALDGSTAGWQALNWLTELAKVEHATVHTLHINKGKTEAHRELARTVKADWTERMQKTGPKSDLLTVKGKTASVVCDYARWMDLVALSLSHPYDSDPRSRLGSGLRSIIRRCPTPVLAIPEMDFRLERMLLAYDDSPKAREALFVATYLAGTCKTCLDVVAAAPSLHLADVALKYAVNYLDAHGVEASFVRESGSAGESLLQVARERGADMIIMGGYGFSPVAELAMGSVVEQVLRARICPVLVCQ
ncbi:MAG: universal stress protein, partial [Anaerolineales bacterium]